MSPFWVQALQLLLSLSLLIILHEGGHFIAARAFNTRVEKFFLFFDVKFALFKKKIGQTVYGIGWLPLGGYVKISGMIDESMDKEQMEKPPESWEFRSKPAWQRLIIMVAGVVVNLLVGALIYMMILFVWGSNYVKPQDMPQGFAVSQTMEDLGFQDGDFIKAINGEPLANQLDVNKYLMVRDVHSITALHPNGQTEKITVPEDIGLTLFKAGESRAFMLMPSKVIDSVIPQSPAAKAGLKEGDKLISINGQQITHYAELNAAKKAHKGEMLTLGIMRDGMKKTVEVTPGEDNMIGISAKLNFTPQHKTYSFSESITAGFSYGYWVLHDYVAQFKYIFTEKGATSLGGFGAIGSLFPDMWNWKQFWATTALISIILAFMNILPIPALDGGHVMFLLYEMVSGRKPNEKVLEYAQMIGLIILLALVLYANGNDVYRYFFK